MNRYLEIQRIANNQQPGGNEEIVTLGHNTHSNLVPCIHFGYSLAYTFANSMSICYNLREDMHFV